MDDAAHDRCRILAATKGNRQIVVTGGIGSEAIRREFNRILQRLAVGIKKRGLHFKKIRTATRLSWETCARVELRLLGFCSRVLSPRRRPKRWPVPCSRRKRWPVPC